MTLLDIGGVPVGHLRPDQFAALRENSLGASESAGALGMSPYDDQTPISIWQRKLKKAPPTPENEAMRWGKLLEPILQAEYERREGVTLETQIFVRHSEHHWLTCTLDGLRPDGRLVEFKTASGYSREWGDEDTDDVPLHYLIQIHHQMLATKATEADLAVLIGGQRFRVYRIERNETLIDNILRGTREFWRCVQSQTPPDWGRLDARALAILHPNCTGRITLGDDIAQAAQTYAENAYMAKRCEKTNETLKSQILAAMGNAEIGALPDGSIIKRYRQEMPERTEVKKAHTRHFFKLLKGDGEE